MALKLDDDQRLDPGQAHYDEEFNKIRQREEAGDFKDSVDNYDKTADPSAENQAVERARQREAMGGGSGNGGWKNSVTGAGGNPSKTRLSFRKQGPIGALIAVLFGGAFGVTAMFSGPSLLLVHIYEEVTGDARVNTQLTSMQVRTNAVLNSKFAESTQGVCGSVINIMCKFTRPSNYLLKQMDANGITALDKDGNAIKSNGLWPNTRPASLRFTDSTGVTHTVQASDFASALRNNPEFAAAFNKAYNPRFVSLMDSVFGKIKARFGFTGADQLNNEENANNKNTGNESDSEKINSEIEKGSAGADIGVDAAKGSADAEETFLKKMFGNSISDLLSKIGNSGKGDAVGMVAGVACAATDIPGMIVKVVRAYQMTQVVLYSVNFLKVAGAIKAGDATPTEVSALGTDLTMIGANGLSAMDSFGMRNLLMGDTGVGKDKVWQKYSPGASIMQSIGGAVSVLDSSAKTDVCNVATSPLTGAGINAALAGGTLGVGTVVNMVVGLVAGFSLQLAAPSIANFIVSLIPKTVWSDIMDSLLGNLTSGLSGASVGDAVASGSEHLMSQTANAGGNMPLSVSDAVAYNKVTNQVNLAYTQQDRATLSPLDASNPHTALGSLVNQFLPYYSDLSSPSGVVSMIGSVVSSSLGSLFNPIVTQAADPSYDYTQCQDPSIQESKTAATPFCAIDYGIPTKYLGISPTQVVSDLEASGDIDPTTGDVVQDNQLSAAAINTVFGAQPDDTSTLSKWMALCTDGSTSAISYQSNACEITNQKTAEYALYTVDHRVEQTMDGEDSSLTNGSVDNSGDSTSTTTSAYQPNNNLSQYVALLNQFNQPVSTPTTPKATTQLATTTSASSFAAQFLTNLPTKRVSGVLA